MELTKTITEKLGNVFITVGQGIVLGSLISGLFGVEPRAFLLLIGIPLGAYTVYAGLAILSQSEHLQE